MSSHSHDSVDFSHHVVPISVYFKTFLALAILMVLTIAAAQVTIVNTFGNNLVAMGIASLKATLVVLFFMNVKNGTNLIKFFAVLGFMTLPLMFIMWADYQFREHELEGAWDRKDPGSAMPRMKIDQSPTDPNMINVRPR